MAARTLLLHAGGVWMWPGIALTERRGAACVPVAPDGARFWITRLHGREANDSAALCCLAIASDGAVLMRAVAGSLGIGPLDLPWADGPRLWRAEVIDAHLTLFKDRAPSAGLVAKAMLKAPRCGGELLAVLMEDEHTSHDTFVETSVP